MSAQVDPIATVEDLDLMPEDGNLYEVIEGEIFASRIGDFTHQLIIGNVLNSLGLFVHKSRSGVAITAVRVMFGDINGIRPDIVFVSKERLNKILIDGGLIGAPELIVEVTSLGAENVRRDRIVKRQLYAKHGVEEYWIIDPQTRSVEVYRLRGRILDLIAMHTDAQLVETPSLPGWSVTADELFRV